MTCPTQPTCGRRQFVFLVLMDRPRRQSTELLKLMSDKTTSCKRLKVSKFQNADFSKKFLQPKDKKFAFIELISENGFNYSKKKDNKPQVFK